MNNILNVVLIKHYVLGNPIANLNTYTTNDSETYD